MLFVRNCNKNIAFYTEEVKACSSNATDSTQQKQSLPSKQINFESTLKRRWSSSTFINIVSTLIFGWKWKLSRRTFMDVVSTLTKQRWSNVDRIMLIQRQWINVVSTLKFGWNWELSRRMFIDVVSTLTKHRWNNIERITTIQCRWPNVVSTLILGWKWKLNQHMFIVVASTLRKQHLNSFVNCCTGLYWCSLEKQKQNKIKFSRTKHIFHLYIRT